MEREIVKKWMDLIIQKNKDLVEAGNMMSRISVCTSTLIDKIQIFEGIEILAEAVDANLQCDQFGEDYQKLYFFYNDVKFFQLVRIDK